MKYEQLRPHQQKAVSMLRDEWKDKKTHQIFAPTGYGKTALAAYLVRSFVERGKKVLFVAPFTVLIEQTAERFQQYGLPEAGIIWRDHPDTNPSLKIQIASADTLIRRDFPEDIDLLIVDENHIKRIKLLEIIENADFPVIGLSGTPFAPWMGNYYESFIKPVTMRQLINKGYLSDYEFYAPMKPDMAGVKVSNSAAYGMDYKEQECAEIMGDAQVVGNIVQNWLENGQNLPTVAFCCNVAHANHTANEFNRAGVTCEVITAKTPQEERLIILERFDNGITKILANVGTLTTGLDKDVRCIIYARPTKSMIRWTQAIGRGIRTAEGKDKCLIFDHSGTVHRLGMPCEYQFDELDRTGDGKDSAEQIRKEVERLESLPKECPKCKFMKPAGVRTCSKCGFEPRSGQDVETDESRQIEKLKGKLEDGELKQINKQEFWSMLKGYQRKRLAEGGKASHGYIAHLYKAKLGVWPRNLHDSPKPPSIEVLNFIKSRNIAFAKRKSKD